MVAAWDIYAEHLMHLRYGHPIWNPQPCPRFGEAHVGDVGYLSEGYFRPLFNAMWSPEENRRRRRGVPSGFQTSQPPGDMLITSPHHISQAALHSKNLHSLSIVANASTGDAGPSDIAGIRYECIEEAGALLMLKRPAHKSSLDCRLLIQKYMEEHIYSWCELANGILGIGLKEKDIIFVSGTTKTPVWAEAASHNGSTRGELVVTGGSFVPSVSGDFQVAMLRTREASVHSHEGPPERVSSWRNDDPALETYDQCIFRNYYKMKSRRWKPTALQAAGGPGPSNQFPGASSHEDALYLVHEAESPISDESEVLEKDGHSLAHDIPYDLCHSNLKLHWAI